MQGLGDILGKLGWARHLNFLLGLDKCENFCCHPRNRERQSPPNKHQTSYIEECWTRRENWGFLDPWFHQAASPLQRIGMATKNWWYKKLSSSSKLSLSNCFELILFWLLHTKDIDVYALSRTKLHLIKVPITERCLSNDTMDEKEAWKSRGNNRLQFHTDLIEVGGCIH